MLNREPLNLKIGLSSSDIKELCNQTTPLDITLNDCWVSQMSSERVAQTITSIMTPSLREEIPVQKYITGTLNLCDGYFSHTVTLHASGFNIHKPVTKE